MRLRDDRGFTVIEVTIGSALAMLLMFSIFSLLDSATRNERGQQARHTALLELRAAGDRITKDVRQALEIHPSSTHTRLAIETIVSGAERAVVYTANLAAGIVTRTECAALTSAGNCTGATPLELVTEARAVGATPVFCYAWDTDAQTCVDAGGPPAALTAIRVTIARAPEINPGQPVLIATDVQLRNL